ncbi:MAG: hypothetical protein RL264_957 [Bacteroidota bacterium]|jgi:tRNA modification GTPase
MSGLNDLICALATPNSVSAIAVIRVSGVGAKQLIEQRFSKILSDKASHTVHFGHFFDENRQMLDEVLVTIFDHGKSFTGEESVEIACHGSVYIQQKILQSLLTTGCRLASPGEFTQRAFLNGKLDLSQAEAIADLIATQSGQAHKVALHQLRGGFSNELKGLRDQLIHFVSLLELELDFAEEDVEFADRTAMLRLLDTLIQKVKRLLKSFELGNALKNGVPVAIIGAPNTGKSTLLNQLLGEERAIVSNIQGTTRDVIEETLHIDGILFRLIDTAGIRETNETIEALGIERSLQKIEQAKIVLLMSDCGDQHAETDNHQSMGFEDAMNWANELYQKYPEKTIVVIGNKMDLSSKEHNPNIQHSGVSFLPISARNGDGVEALTQFLVASITADYDLSEETIVSNARHFEQLYLTANFLERAQNGLKTGVTGDFVAMDLRIAMRHLGNITGQIDVDEDILGTIFSSFCIGK